MFCRRSALNMFAPLGSRRRVTNRGWLGPIAEGTCTDAGGDLTDNHRMFLNIEVTFCMKPAPALPVELLRLMAGAGAARETRVGFLSRSALVWSSSSSEDEHLMVCADSELVSLSRFVVFVFLYLLGRSLLPDSLKLLLLLI